MMKFYFVVFVTALILFSSCSKVEDEVIMHDNDSGTRYYPMSVGSYWIYDEFKMDPQGEVPVGTSDSTYIERDTLINGNEYFLFLSSSFPQWSLILRDSSNNLVDQDGVVYFCADAIGDTIYREVRYNNFGDTIFAQFRVMEQVPDVFFVPAGFFSVIDAINYTYLPKAITVPKEQAYNNYYAKDVGLVYRTFLRFGTAHSMKLVRYHINK